MLALPYKGSPSACWEPAAAEESQKMPSSAPLMEAGKDNCRPAPLAQLNVQLCYGKRGSTITMVDQA